jgi:putative ABC transport system permease protein
MPRSQVGSFSSLAAVLVRTSGNVKIAAELRRVIQAVDPHVPITSIRSMTDVASTALAQQRFNMMLIGIFAASALLLTMVGLYGLLSYQVSQRTREIGVRMALGARRADVLRAIVVRGLMLTFVGIVIGVAGSLGLGRFLETLLFGVSATSPWIFAIVAGALFVVAFLASVVPARRAMRVEPVIALRYE